MFRERRQRIRNSDQAVWHRLTRYPIMTRFLPPSPASWPTPAAVTLIHQGTSVLYDKLSLTVYLWPNRTSLTYGKRLTDEYACASVPDGFASTVLLVNLLPQT